MKIKVILMSASLLFAFGPATAKIDKEFPSMSIQPFAPTSEPLAPASKEDGGEAIVIPAPLPRSAPCSGGHDGMESRDEGERVICDTVQEPPAQAAPNTYSDSMIDARSEGSSIPQLKAFRQQSWHRFAP